MFVSSFIIVSLSFLYLACDQTYTSPNGIIKSMNYPGNYESNLNCKYLISPPPKAGYIISINFRDFDIQYSYNCTDDLVSVFDGETTTAPLLSNYCGTTKPSAPRSSGNKLFIVLKSNAVTNSKGFELSYQSGNSHAAFRY